MRGIKQCAEDTEAGLMDTAEGRMGVFTEAGIIMGLMGTEAFTEAAGMADFTADARFGAGFITITTTVITVPGVWVV